MAGPTGRVVDYMLERHGAKRRDTWITNVVLCKAEKVPDKAIECCKPRLEAELGEVQPKRVLLAGSEPVKLFLQGGLKDTRGLRHYDCFDFPEVDRTLTVATWNPAILMREAGYFPDLINDFRRLLQDPKDYTEPKVFHNESAEECILFLRGLKPGLYAVDIESTGLHVKDELVSIGFGLGAETAFVIGHKAVRDVGVVKALTKLFSRTGFTWLWHNGKFDLRILREHGIMARVDEDTMLANYALDERGGTHDLAYMTQNELDWPDYESQEVKDAKKNRFRTEPIVEFRYLKGRNRLRCKVLYFGISDWSNVYRYNGFDCIGSHKLHSILKPRIEEDGVSKAYRELLIPGSNALCEVERRGIGINVERAQEILAKEVTPRLHELTFRAQCLVGNEINLNSPTQVASFCYDGLGLTDPLFRPGKERSVDSANRDEWLRVLGEAEVSRNPELARDFLEVLDEFKKLDKLRGTYLEGLIKRVSRDSRLYCDLLLHGTETGRLSSRNPNLQNIPRVDPGAKYVLPNIKSIFQAAPGNVLLQADYSQAELRCAALFSRDPGLLRVYSEGRDLHSEVAAAHYGKNYTKEQRFYAKTLNFGILYGAGAYTISREITRRSGKMFTQEEANAFIQSWWHQFPGVKNWVNGVHKTVRGSGELTSPFGRKRRFHIITEQNLDHTLKEAVNFYMQSTASDFTLWSLINLVQAKAPVWLAVHDSILLEVPEDRAAEFGAKVKAVMESAPTAALGKAWGDIPITVDVQIGTDWGHLEDLEVAA